MVLWQKTVNGKRNGKCSPFPWMDFENIIIFTVISISKNRNGFWEFFPVTAAQILKCSLLDGRHECAQDLCHCLCPGLFLGWGASSVRVECCVWSFPQPVLGLSTWPFAAISYSYCFQCKRSTSSVAVSFASLLKMNTACREPPCLSLRVMTKSSRILESEESRELADPSKRA